MDARLTCVTLGVADLERATRFYRALGWRPSSAGNAHLTLFQLGPLVLALYDRRALADDAGLAPAGPGFGGIALAQNVATKPEVAAALAQAQAAGGRILRPAQDVFWGGHSGYFADPDGHAWEVAWNPHWTLGSDGQVALP